MSHVLVHALVPTARAVSWTPLLAVATGLLALSALLRVQDATSQVVLSLGVGCVAGTLVHALRDPAAALLAAVPVPRAARCLLRLGLAATVALPLWLLVTAVLPGAGTELAPLAALVATGLAVATWLPVDGPVTVATGVPLLWVTIGQILSGVDGPVGLLATLWSTHPLPVAAAGALLFTWGRDR